MKLEAMDGRVVLTLVNQRTSKIELPENYVGEECPTFEVAHVGKGRESQYTGKREEIPLKKGDLVVVAQSRCVMVTIEGEKVFIVDWNTIFARVWK